MTRTNKWTVHEKASEPKWFTRNGHPNQDPTKVKKEGAGNHNWGKPGDELDYEDINMFNKLGRRNSNHEMNEEKLNTLERSCEDKLL